MTKFINTQDTQCALKGTVYTARVGLVVNDKGNANFVGLEEGANIFILKDGKKQSMGETTDSAFKEVVNSLFKQYIKHNQALCEEWFVVS